MSEERRRNVMIVIVMIVIVMTVIKDSHIIGRGCVLKTLNDNHDNDNHDTHAMQQSTKRLRPPL